MIRFVCPIPYAIILISMLHVIMFLATGDFMEVGAGYERLTDVPLGPLVGAHSSSILGYRFSTAR